MWKKWIPWRFFLKKLAQKQGFLDPIAFLSKLQGFGQPSEVTLPIEIIRLATVLIARGSLNVVAIQHNLDWNWPYWVVRQFNPRDISFIPRAFSLTHINLTHRNWTAVGIPGLAEYPLVDPRGLLTPFLDKWSLDAWVVQADGKESLISARLPSLVQKWDYKNNPSIDTQAAHHHLKMHSRVTVEKNEHGPYCVMTVEAHAPALSWLVISARPFNPEGVSEINHIRYLEQETAWQINKKEKVFFSETPDQHLFSQFKEGDVYRKIISGDLAQKNSSGEFLIECPSGMATAAVLFRIPEKGVRKIEVQIPLASSRDVSHFHVEPSNGVAEKEWTHAMQGSCQLHVQDKSIQNLYDAAVRTMLLHAPGVDVFPGPYTYKHFWFRDAAFILHAFLAANLRIPAEKILDHFPSRQKFNGFFCSQDGEWDSNGQVLWIFRRFCELTGIEPKTEWKDAIQKGAEWIVKKRLSEDISEPHAGLLPPGFSAEHLGPNDYYYWDDFWGIEGLRSASRLMLQYSNSELARRYEEEADRFEACLMRSLGQSEERLGTKAMPASPYRRLDTGAIGSLAAGYPLHFWESSEARVMQTVEYLLKNHFIEGGFFHDMSHSGINPYLTLTVAQILLRNGDIRFADILRHVCKLASPTGQWPEAVNPQTLGGCMGDGQHVWAAAEWVLMIRNCFVREEDSLLIFCSGVLPEWYEDGKKISFGETLTPAGAVSIYLQKEDAGIRVSWDAKWRESVTPSLEIRLPGYGAVQPARGESSVLLTKRKHT